MAEPGRVYLVGAGPGDPGLLTLKGRACLAEADVVVYDYLANDQLLAHAEKAAELIYVGKQADRHALEQHEINTLLVVKAREGHTVVRLKGGDPYVFGRGGEEALALLDAGIPFEVVPGITAAVAGPAYAGIPVTHRGYTSTLTLVTGHEDPSKSQSAIDWPALAKGGGTLAFYMGVKNLPHIVEKLIEGGRAADTPAALIRWGTRPIQRVVSGTLADIVDKVRDAKLTPPCMIVVGEVIALREKLNWFETQPLFGKTIAITRSREQASDLAARLVALGANVLSFPTIRFEPPKDEDELRGCMDNLSDFDWIVFTSVNGVERFFAVLKQTGRDSRGLAGVKICCIGSATANELARYGIVADLIPPRFTSAATFDALVDREDLSGKRFLLPRADIAGRDLPAKLRTAGADVTDVPAYRTVPGEPSSRVIDAFREGHVDLVTFTSSSTATNFASIIKEALGALPSGPVYVSIGPETSKAAREAGLDIRVEADVHTIDGLVSTIVKAFAGETQ